MNPKEFYKTYQADNHISGLSKAVYQHISREKPNHVLEFGCGTGKNLSLFNVCTIGIDISILNVLRAKLEYELPCVICSDETYLRNFANVDVVFTVSVLDHIEDIREIISEFKRIANKSVFLAETTEVPGEHYFSHDYERYGFKKVKSLDIDETNKGLLYTETDEYWWRGEDGAIYNIYKWEKCAELAE